MLKYENKKTGSLLIIPENSLSSIEDDMYLLKIMVYNDRRIIKNKMTDLVTVLQEVRNVK